MSGTDGGGGDRVGADIGGRIDILTAARQMCVCVGG